MAKMLGGVGRSKVVGNSRRAKEVLGPWKAKWFVAPGGPRC